MKQELKLGIFRKAFDHLKILVNLGLRGFFLKSYLF